MKRCPKCNRTFPEESQKFCTVDGGLLITEPAFDPNMTIRATSDDLGSPTIGFANEQATSRKLPDLGATILSPAPGSTRTSGDIRGKQTSSDLPPLPQPAAATTGALPAKKKSKLPLILGILAALLVMGIAGLAAAFFLVVKPRLEQM